MAQPNHVSRPADHVSSDERILAGIAHLALCGGLWLVVPLAIFFYKRKDSPFVAFHALQATLLALAIVPIALGAWMFALVAQIAGTLVLRGPNAAYLFMILFPAAAFAPTLAVLAVGVVAGFR